MFERNFTYKDLEQVETEIENIHEALANVYNNKSCIWKISRTLDKLKNSNFSSEEEYLIDVFESRYVKCMNRTNETINFLQKFTKRKDFKILSNTARDLIDEIEQHLLILEQKDIYYTNKIMFRGIIIKYIKSIRILKIQKEIVKKSIKSIDIEDKKKLYIKFLKNEGEIYRIYNNLPDKFIKDKKTYISHLSNSMLSDAKEIIAKSIKYKIFSVLNFVVFGALLCIPYFLELKRVPEISAGSIPISLVAVFAIGISLTLYLYILVFLQNYFLFRGWYESKNKVKLCFMGIDFSMILLMTFIPVIHDKLNLSSSSYEHIRDAGCLLKICLTLHAIFLLSFSYKFWRDNKDELSDILLAALLIFISDLLILLVIYFNYTDDYILVVIPMVLLSFMIRFLQISKKFSYRYILFVLSFVVFVLLSSASGFFVRAVGLANYQIDLDIRKDNIPEYILNLNIKCQSKASEDIEFIKYTCILDDKSGLAIKFKNILVKLKSDGKYWLEVASKDRNESEIDNYRFWVSEKNIVN
ncbi:hypothetical protein [uncultured Campylobacter sp.]|uniref:hypothetical protein n=1 Tax=uncultured Campylobacter sp. TaxID=218934 RepID=UPI00260AE99F|nr:hypothetical protein [uncultured Campylobacter sp.]